MSLLTTIGGAVAAALVTAAAYVASIGLLPLFLIALAMVITLTIMIGVTYLVMAFLWQLAVEYVRFPVRPVLVYFADLIPPSIGTKEVPK